MAYRNRIVSVIAGAACLLTTVSAGAEEWKILGPRALGMGGAHVAVVNDSTAQYWNPAVFGFFGRQASEMINKDEHSDKDFGAYIQGGAGFQAHQDIIKEIDDLSAGGLDFDALSTDIQTGNLSSSSNVDDFIKMIAELDDLNKDKIAISFIAHGAMNVRLRSFGLGVIGSADVAAIPQMDLVNINPTDVSVAVPTDITTELGQLQTYTGADTTFQALTPAQETQLSTTIDGLTEWSTPETTQLLYALDDALVAAGYDKDTNPVPQEYVDATETVAVLANNAVTGGSFDDNESKILFRGALIAEVPLSYGYALSDNLAIGGNLKYIKARTYHSEVLVFDSDTQDLFKDATNDYMESNSFGVDLAALYKLDSMRFGIVGRNLNKPSFDQKAAGNYELDPQIRIGAAYRLWNMVTLAADFDVTENDTIISNNYKSQNIAGGVEVDLLRFLQLRGGVYKNLSEEDIGIVYTAGAGLNFYLLQIDLAAALSADRATIDGNELPEEIRGQLAVSFQF